MTALTINVSDRDTIHGWDSIRLADLSPLEKDYRNALAKLDEVQSDYIDACDHLEDTKLYHPNNLELIDHWQIHVDRLLVRLDEAEERKHLAYVRLNCDHHQLIDVDPFFGVPAARMCPNCGLFEDQFEFHTTTVTSSQSLHTSGQ